MEILGGCMACAMLEERLARHEIGAMWYLEVLQGAEAVQCIDAWLRHTGPRLGSQLLWSSSFVASRMG